MNCNTESYFLIMFSMVGRIWIHDGPRVENHCFMHTYGTLFVLEGHKDPISNK